MPAFEPDVPAHRWPLSPAGRAAARALVLPVGAYLAASSEPKAYQTLAHAGPVALDQRFGEVTRVDEPWDGRYRELRRAYVDGTDHVGWEPRAAVAARFDAAITDHLTRARGSVLVVATHGMAMTVWLTARIDLRSPGEFWAGLQFPDAIEVDLSSGRARPASGSW